MIEDIPSLARRAATYRALSLLFLPPSDAAAAELRALGADLMASDPRLAEPLLALAEDAGAPLGSLYHLALGPSGAVRDGESDYEVNPLGGKGPLIADVAGFYRAFLYEDRTVHGLGPDHVSTELGFMAWLALRRAYALHAGEVEGAEVCAAAERSFVAAHLGRWAATFFARMRERCPETWYDAAAQLADVTLAALEPGAIAAAQPDRAKVSLPTLDDSDECGLPPDL